MLPATAIPPHPPLSRAEYDRLVASGFFEDERIELLGGALVPMSPQGPFHAELVSRLVEIFVPLLAGRARVRAQSPLALSPDSEPEPDLALVPTGSYRNDHPATAYLVVEVAYSSLAKDQGIKRALYAACGIPEYWIVHGTEPVIEVHREPEGSIYRHIFTRGRGDWLDLVAFPDIRIALDDVW